MTSFPLKLRQLPAGPPRPPHVPHGPHFGFKGPGSGNPTMALPMESFLEYKYQNHHRCQYIYVFRFLPVSCFGKLNSFLQAIHWSNNMFLGDQSSLAVYIFILCLLFLPIDCQKNLPWMDLFWIFFIYVRYSTITIFSFELFLNFVQVLST